MIEAGSAVREFTGARFARSAIRTATLLLVLGSGSAIAYTAWDVILLPFSNPLSVVGSLAIQRFNPANNIVRFGIFAMLPAIVLCALAALRVRPLNHILFDSATPTLRVTRPASRGLRFAMFAATVVFASLVSLTVPTYHASGLFDPFHEGESLGTAMSLEHGITPYRDVIFLHGLIQDPYRSELAFQLFGRSIGAVRTLESLTKVVNWMLLAAVVVLLFHEDYLIAVPGLLALMIMQREFSIIVYRHLIDKTFVCYRRLAIILPPRPIVLFLFLFATVIGRVEI